MACGGEEPAPPQSAPVSSSDGPPTAAKMTIQAGEEPVPVGVPALVGRWPALGELDQASQRRVAAALNLVPASCAPCREERESLARCSLRSPSPVCANTGPLVTRAVKLGAAAAPLEVIRDAVNYPDAWFPTPSESGEVIGEQAAPVRVDLWRDRASPWAGTAQDMVAELQQRFPGTIRIHIHDKDSESAVAFGVRSTPTWAVAGYRMRGAQSLKALSRIVVREAADGATGGTL